ncbi:MobC family plasmid mobilization relaxosome protein [Brucella anthropi]|uniref:plasmid mobilization protein n=1 Tax=Brucella anthropi TaxID=529 RepID=UPI00124BD807|nr:plasmid mobilization relaxosome protein MobC [Brucella anthropi]KAB2774647.1 MobC family plasmid mobilization relaxosome protein [Brucella anthropi]
MSASNSRKATSVISFRMTPGESEALRASAKAHGLGVTSFARRAAFDAASLPHPAYETKKPDPRKVEIAKLIGEVNRIGGNVNQIAKICNTVKQAPSSKDVKALFAEVRALRVDILKALE